MTIRHTYHCVVSDQLNRFWHTDSLARERPPSTNKHSLERLSGNSSKPRPELLL